MNIDNMKRLKRHLELEGEGKFRYDVWAGHTEDPDNPYAATDDVDTIEGLKNFYNGTCGMVGCIGGMANAIAVVEDGLTWEEVCINNDFEVSAQKWLGLDDTQAFALFYGQAMVLAGLYKESGEAMAKATAMEAAKTLQMVMDGEVILPTNDD